MFTRTLRPTGNKIKMGNKPLDNQLFAPFVPHFYQSGTAALAAAIIAANKKNKKTKAEILLPAYTCPDIISAVVFANAIPILIDLKVNSPRMSLKSIENKITPNTNAIIAINFLGISEDICKIRKICDKYNLTLIEDSAQAVPNQSFSPYWQGDYIIISFGRGKPLNLLGGGAVLNKPDKELNNNLTIVEIKKGSTKNKFLYSLKIFIYNILINPTIYGLILQLPGLKIGSTHFKPLHEIGAINDFSLNKLAENYTAYKKQNKTGDIIRKHISTVTNDSIIDLTILNKTTEMFLRYPLLIKNIELRNKILDNFSDKGVSSMYGIELNKIDGTQKYLNTNENFPNAHNFSASLITFPIHSDFHEKDIIEIVDFIHKETKSK